MDRAQALKTDVDNTTVELEEHRKTAKRAVLEEPVVGVEQENKRLKRRIQCLQSDQIGLEGSVRSLKSDQEDMQQRLTYVEEKQNTTIPQISCGNIKSFA